MLLYLNNLGIGEGRCQNKQDSPEKLQIVKMCIRDSDGRAFGIEKLHADLEERFALLVPEQVEELESVFRRLEVAGDNYVVLHHIRF